jgi:hypothetical protein
MAVPAVPPIEELSDARIAGRDVWRHIHVTVEASLAVGDEEDLMLCRWKRATLDPFNDRLTWPVARNAFDERTHSRAVAFDINEEVRTMIANEAPELQLVRKRIDERAKSNALHQPGHLDSGALRHVLARHVELYEASRAATTLLRLTEVLRRYC